MQTVIHGSSPIIKVSIKLLCIKSMPQKDGFIFNPISMPWLHYRYTVLLYFTFCKHCLKFNRVFSCYWKKKCPAVSQSLGKWAQSWLSTGGLFQILNPITKEAVGQEACSLTSQLENRVQNHQMLDFTKKAPGILKETFSDRDGFWGLTSGVRP